MEAKLKLSSEFDAASARIYSLFFITTIPREHKAQFAQNLRKN